MVDSVQPSRNPANSGGDAAGAFTEILNKFLKSSIDDMLPAKVIAYDRDKNRATVKPLIMMMQTDGGLKSREQIASVPVFNIGGGGFILSFNIKPGDLGWIKANDRDIAEFLKGYNESSPATMRAHDFSSGVFFPDVMTGYEIDEEDAENAVLQTLDGTVRIAIWPDKVKVTGPELLVDCPQTTMTGNLTVEGNQIVIGNADLATGGGSVNLGVGGKPIARKDDPVSGGVIIADGSSKHKAT